MGLSKGYILLLDDFFVVILGEGLDMTPSHNSGL